MSCALERYVVTRELHLFSGCAFPRPSPLRRVAVSPHRPFAHPHGCSFQEPPIGRAKNSARPTYGLIFGFSAPVLSRDPERITSEKIEPNRTLYSHPSGAKPHAQHGSKPARTHQQRNHTLGAPSFSPYRSEAPNRTSRSVASPHGRSSQEQMQLSRNHVTF